MEHDSGDIEALWSQSIYTLLYIVDNTDTIPEGLRRDGLTPALARYMPVNTEDVGQSRP